jgi:hypothetical protein
MSHNDYKKIAVFIILVTVAAIVWHERLPNFTSSGAPLSEDNPFVDIKEVPLRLDSLDLPEGELRESETPAAESQPWGRNPFVL